MERKGELKAANAEKGGSMSEIQSQLDLMDEQLKNIDEQIAKAQAEELKTEEEDKEGKIYDKPKTEAEAESDKLSTITQMASGVDNMEILASVKGKVDGEIQVLEAEIESGFGNMEQKIEKVSELRSQSNDLLEQAGEYAVAANESAAEINRAEEAVKPTGAEANNLSEPDDMETLLEQAEEERQLPIN